MHYFNYFDAHLINIVIYILHLQKSAFNEQVLLYTIISRVTKNIPINNIFLENVMKSFNCLKTI